jgi:hypothetical protein
MTAQRKNRSIPRAFKGAALKAATHLMRTVQTIGASVHPHPIYILGNQKAGTTAIAALLGEMTGRSVTLDIKREMKDPAIPRVIRGDLPFTEFVKLNKLDFSREIIKEPSLTLLYEDLVRFFPQSKYIMVIRDPRENLRSILQRLEIPGDLKDLSIDQERKLPKAWRLIVDGAWLGLDGENYVEMLAQRWNYTTDRYREFKERTDLIRFEDFLADKVGEITRLAGLLDLPRKRDVSGRVDVQFQPPGDRSVGWKTFFGVDNLARIERICGQRMERFDYERIV